MDSITTGKLYVVATPIGNSRDMSPRGIQVLTDVDIIAAEDTRRSMILMNKLEIKNKLVSNHKFNEFGKSKYFINEMRAGKSVAIITDAGTPCISDPGNELIKAAISEGITVVSVPGCCAAVAALSISGFDLTSFTFLGFFPRENADRKKILAKIREGSTPTYVIYESPLRIMDLVDFFIEQNAGIRLCLCNDITKLHDMTFRGSPVEVKQQLLNKGNYDKGEYVAVIEIEEDYVFRKNEHVVSAEAMLVDSMVKKGLNLKDAIADVLSDENNSYSKNELKTSAINVKKLLSDY